MRRFALVSAPFALVLLGSVACGEAAELSPPIPPEAYDLTGEGPAGDCSLFPDDCGDGRQCYLDRDTTDTIERICGAAGGKGLGEACSVNDRAEYCGPNLVCVNYQNGTSKCQQMCLTDLDCGVGAGGAGGGGAGGAGGAGVNLVCEALSGGSGLSVCPL